MKYSVFMPQTNVQWDFLSYGCAMTMRLKKTGTGSMWVPVISDWAHEWGFFFFLDILRILSQIYILYTWTFSIILNKTKWIEHKQRWYTILIKAFYRIIVDSSCCYKLLRSTSHFFWTSNKRCITGHLCKNKDCEKLVTWIKVSG